MGFVIMVHRFSFATILSAPKKKSDRSQGGSVNIYLYIMGDEFRKFYNGGIWRIKMTFVANIDFVA